MREKNPSVLHQPAYFLGYAYVDLVLAEYVMTLKTRVSLKDTCVFNPAVVQEGARSRLTCQWATWCRSPHSTPILHSKSMQWLLICYFYYIDHFLWYWLVIIQGMKASKHCDNFLSSHRFHSRFELTRGATIARRGVDCEENSRVVPRLIQGF
jgi:hypothetical protein